MAGLSLDLIVNDGALWGLLGELRLNQRLDSSIGTEGKFDLDLDAQKLIFGDDDLTAVPHLIASVAPGPETVRWGWALPDLSSLASTDLSERVRDFGRSQEIPELLSDEVPFAAFSAEPLDGQTTADAVATRVGIVASQVIGEIPWLVVPVGDTRVVLLLQDGPDLAPPELGTLMTVLPEALMTGALTDPPRAIQHLLQRVPDWQPEWGTAGVRISAGGGHVDVHLDGDGQVIEIQADL